MMRPRNLAAAIAIVFALAPEPGSAQATITIGTPGDYSTAPGSVLTIPVVADLSTALGGTLSTIGVSLSWNPATITLDSIRAVGPSAVTSSLAGISTGSASFTAAGLPAGTGTISVANLFFTASGRAGGTRLYVYPTSAANARGSIRLGQVASRHAEVCVALSGIWGDANGDGSVSIIDAQQIARAVVGLPVASAASVTTSGDVNDDGSVDILDAQQIARFSIALPASPRIDTRLSATPIVASLAAFQMGTLQLGGTTTVVSTPKDAADSENRGCAPLSFASSDPSTISVTAGGGVRGLRPGTATITVTSGSQTAQVPITVVVPDSTAALLRLRNVTAAGPTNFTESTWFLSGLVADEWKSGDTFPGRNNMDRRTVPDADALVQRMLGELMLARSSASAAARTLTAAAAPPDAIAQMYFIMGYAKLLMGETFCNGVVLDDASGGLVVSGAPQSNAELFARAIAYFDSALAIAPGSAPVADLARIAKARALVDAGNPSGAAAIVVNVATAFQFLITPAANESNKFWLLTTSQRRFGVGDSIDTFGLLRNAIPFVSARDPRVPTGATITAFDGSSIVVQSVWTQQSPVPLLSGIDARLIDAEARLAAGDFQGMTAILNALRATPQNLGSISSPAMLPLPAPSSQAQAVTLFFREKAFWTFGRGQRLGDMRRMVRSYGRAEDTVFPTGIFFKGGSYGNTMSFPASVDEQGNLLAAACTDRNP